MSKFIKSDDVQTESFDWGSAGMRCAPPGTGCASFVIMDVRLDPGFFHAFHKHPDQDEMITIVSGQVTQFLEGESTTLGPGDSVYIDKDVVHGSYNDSAQPAQLSVVLAPAVGDGGYVAVDVSGEAPWSNLR